MGRAWSSGNPTPREGAGAEPQPDSRPPRASSSQLPVQMAAAPARGSAGSVRVPREVRLFPLGEGESSACAGPTPTSAGGAFPPLPPGTALGCNGRPRAGPSRGPATRGQLTWRRQSRATRARGRAPRSALTPAAWPGASHPASLSLRSRLSNGEIAGLAPCDCQNSITRPTSSGHCAWRKRALGNGGGGTRPRTGAEAAGPSVPVSGGEGLGRARSGRTRRGLSQAEAFLLATAPPFASVGPGATHPPSARTSSTPKAAGEDAGRLALRRHRTQRRVARCGRLAPAAHRAGRHQPEGRHVPGPAPSTARSPVTGLREEPESRRRRGTRHCEGVPGPVCSSSGKQSRQGTEPLARARSPAPRPAPVSPEGGVTAGGRGPSLLPSSPRTCSSSQTSSAHLGTALGSP